MRTLSWPRLLMVPALLFTLISSPAARGEGVVVHFDTADGVKIEGSFWASKNGKDAPVALLLPDVRLKGGSDCHADGWDSLAKALNAKGFAVLQFDFRGFGQSQTISTPMLFWTQMHNKVNNIRVAVNPMKLPETLSSGTFNPGYMPYLVNDVAAAKAFLDRKNDAGELNVSNLVVIGAGQGATIGSLWLASEFHRKRGTPQLMGIRWEPAFEGKDVRAVVWLDICPTLENLNRPVQQWVTEGSGSKFNKVPTNFIYPKEDQSADARALRYMQAILPGYTRKNRPKDDALPLSGDTEIATKLTGSKLLDKKLGTEKWIVESYLGSDDMKKALKEEWRDRDSAKSNQYYLFQTVVLPAKNGSESYVVPVKLLGVIN